MAVESIAGICQDENVVSQFAVHPEYLNALASRLEDQPVFFTAYSMLYNYSADVVDRHECLEDPDQPVEGPTYLCQPVRSYRACCPGDTKLSDRIWGFRIYATRQHISA